jgi:hypothetical protein
LRNTEDIAYLLSTPEQLRYPKAYIEGDTEAKRKLAALLRAAKALI